MAARKTPKQSAPRSKAAVGVVLQDTQDAAAWRAECERLRADLEAARAEIADLRARHDQVVNRIDWVLDSLDSLADPR